MGKIVKKSENQIWTSGIKFDSSVNAFKVPKCVLGVGGKKMDGQPVVIFQGSGLVCWLINPEICIITNFQREKNDNLASNSVSWELPSLFSRHLWS